jgi:cell division protein FtsL
LKADVSDLKFEIRKMIRRVPSKQRNTLVKRERDPRALTRLAMLLLCGLCLAGGFIYAGGRHFAALRLGYETEKLRNGLNSAREDQRRLLLEREAATSPARLEVAARKLGMQPMQAAQIDPIKQRQDVSNLKPVAETRTPAKADAKRKSKQDVRVR